MTTDYRGTDFIGQEIKIGQVVAYADRSGRTGNSLNIGKVLKLTPKGITIETKSEWREWINKPFDKVIVMSKQVELFYKLGGKLVDGEWKEGG